MNRGKKLYFVKTYKLLINSISLPRSYQFHQFNSSYQHADDIPATTYFQPNKIIDIVVLNVLENGSENTDPTTTLEICSVIRGVKRPIAVATFDLATQKITSPKSTDFYEMEIRGESGQQGAIQYKFVAANTVQVTEGTYKQYQLHRNKVMVEEKRLLKDQEYNNVLAVMKEKDKVIEQLEQQVHKLAKQMTRKSVLQRQQSINRQSSPISFNVNFKSPRFDANLNKVKVENEALKRQLKTANEQLVSSQKENQYLEGRIQYIEAELNRVKGRNSKSVSLMKKTILDRSQILDNKDNIRQLSLNTSKISNQASSSGRQKKAKKREGDDFRRQIEAATEVSQIQIQKNQLFDKLKLSIKEIDLLKDEVQNLNLYVRKLTDELKILRKNNSPDGIMTKIEAIRSENQILIEQLRKKGKLTVQQQIFSREKQNLQIKAETYKSQIQTLQNQLQVSQKQHKQQSKQQQIHIYSLQKQIAEHVKQRQIANQQLNQLKDSIEKELNTTFVQGDIAKKVDQMAKDLTEAKKQNQIITRALQNEKTAYKQVKAKLDATVIDMRSQGDELVKLKTADQQVNFFKKKIDYYQLEIKKYEDKFKQLKGFAFKVEQTFNNFYKDKNKVEYEKQLATKIQTFEQLIDQAEKEFFESRVDGLINQKQAITQNSFRILNNALIHIDNDPDLSPEQKKIAKQKKQIQLAELQRQQIAALDIQITKMKQKKEQQQLDLKKLALPDRIKDLQKKIKGKMLESQVIMKENQQMKEAIAKLNTQIKEQKQLTQKGTLAESKYRPKEHNVSADNKDIGLKMSNTSQELALARSNFDEEMKNRRTKFYESWQVRSKELHQRNMVITKENTDLKISVSHLKNEQQKMKRQMEFAKKKMETQVQNSKKEVEKIKSFKETEGEKSNQRQQQLNNKIAELKQDLAANQEAMIQLQKTTREIALESDQKSQVIQKLTQVVEQKERFINEYDNSTKELIQTMEQIKKQTEHDKATMTQLLDQRNEKFVHIQKIKARQILSLQNIIKQQETKLEAQVADGMRLKDELNFLNNAHEELNKVYQTLKTSLDITTANYQQQFAQLNEQLVMYRDVNLQLQKNMMDIGEQFNGLEEQIALATVQKEAMNKQIKVLKQVQGALQRVQDDKYRQKMQLSRRIQDKQQQIKKYQTDLLMIQQRVRILGEENQKLSKENKYYQAENMTLQSQLHAKALQIIAIAQEKSIANIHKAAAKQELHNAQQQLIKLRLQLAKLVEAEKELQSKCQLLTQMNEEAQARQNSRNIKPVQAPIISRGPSVEDSPLPSIAQDSKIPHQQAQIVEVQNLAEPMEPSTIEVIHIPSEKDLDLAKMKELSSSKKMLNQNHQSLASSHQQLLMQYERTVIERDQLLSQVHKLTKQLQQIKNQNHSQQQIIKISEESEPAQNKSWSLGKIADSREINNTQENTNHQDQLLIQQLKKQNQELVTAVQQEKSNVQRLISTLQQLQADIDRLNSQIQQLNYELQQKSLQNQAQRKQDEEKLQEILAELMQKETTLTNTLHQLQNAQIRSEQAQARTGDLEMQIQARQESIQELNNKINKLKLQYRKYEEEAELEILTLKEKFDQAIQISKNKDNQITELADKYLNLEEGAAAQSAQMGRVQGSLENTMQRNHRLQDQSLKHEKERQDMNQTRKKLMKKIHELQIEIVRGHEQLMEANKNASLAISKSNIKIQGMQEEVNQARSRSQQKDSVIIELKNQIALYNDECSQLKRANDQLDYEIQRVTQQMKDIMVNYERQFAQLNQHNLKVAEAMRANKTTCDQKQKLISSLRMDNRESERGRMSAESELRDVKNAFDKYKKARQCQYNDKCTELEIKTNEAAVLQTDCDKVKEELRQSQKKIEEANRNYQRLYQQYSIKMSKYQEGIQEMSKEIAEIGLRPSKEQYDQLKFQKQLLKTRLSQAEQAGQRNQTQDNGVQFEFRKYKANKEALIRNLQTEMESYGGKINELQEANFYLRKQNQDLRQDAISSRENQQDLQDQLRMLQEDFKELQDQLQYYKNKQKSSLTRLLNQTYD